MKLKKDHEGFSKDDWNKAKFVSHQGRVPPKGQRRPKIVVLTMSSL